MEGALPLITFGQESNSNSHSAFEVSEAALQYLESIPAPISVVAVAGMYRTGKSYLLNRVILNQKLGFQVGPSVNPCTKGLWLWGRTLSAVTTEDEPCQVVVIDSEGIGALDEDADHDCRIFSLAVLLASAFIYNSSTSIDETSLENLSLVVNLTKHIHVRSQQSEEADETDYAAYFPAFFWVVRDFSLQLVDEKGDKITSRDYLERALAEQKGFSEATENKNRIRRLLKGFFPERDCFTLVRPTNSEEQLRRLDSMEISDLRPEFQTQVYKLRERILTKVRPKTLNGRALSGAMLANLLRAYVVSINEGAVPSIESAWTYICQNECAKAREEAWKIYMTETEGSIVPRLPMMTSELKQWHKQAKQSAISTFAHMAVGTEKEAVERELSDQIAKRFHTLRENNEELALEQAEDFLVSLYDRIGARLRSGEFDDFQKYYEELCAFQTYFRENGPQGTERLLQMTEFSFEKIVETVEIFFKKLNNEIEVNEQLAAERQAALSKEITDIKTDYAQYRNSSQRTIAALENEKTELTVINSTLSTQLQIARADNERLEKENRETIKALKQEHSAQIQEANRRISGLEESLKEADQRLVQFDSDHQQEIALISQKASFLEKSLEELSHRENALFAELTDQKKQHSATLKETVTKHEESLIKYQRQVMSETDRCAELERSLMEMTAKMEVLETKKRESETAFEGKINSLSGQIGLINQQWEGKEKEWKIRSEEASKEAEDAQSRLQSIINDLKQRLKSLDDSYNSEQSKLLRESAISAQKIEFLEQHLSEAQRQLQESEQRHESVVAALHSASSSLNQGAVDQQILQIREEMAREMKAQQGKSDEERNRLLKELADLAEKQETMSVTMKGDATEWRTKEQTYTERIEALTGEKTKLLEKLTEAEVNKGQGYEKTIDKLEARVEELECDLEDARKKSSTDMANLKQRVSENMQQLTAAYEAEKTRLNQKIQEEKEKAETRINAVLEEYERKQREDLGLTEDRISDLEGQLQDVSSSLEAERAQFQKQMALNAQKIEALEKHLKETKETLANLQTTHGTTMEQHLQSFQKERSSLQMKIEKLATDLSSKDKDLMTALYNSEQLQSQLTTKEREVEETRAELGTERAMLQERLEDAKIKWRQVSEESARKKSEYMKELALAKQELEFQSKRIGELIKLKEDSERRYQEALASLKEERTKETADAVDRLTQEKDILEKKLTQKRKELKDSEESFMKQITSLEKERAIATEKLASLESRLADTETRHSQELAAAQRAASERRDPDAKSFVLQQEVERLQVKLFEAEKEMADKSSAYDRDKTLWDNKFNFLIAQRDAARTELANTQRKFDQNLEEVRKLALTDKERPSGTQQIEARFSAQLREMQENAASKAQELQERNKGLERDLRIAREELELERREKSSNSGSLAFRLQELTDAETKLKAQLQTQTALWERRLAEEKEAFDREKAGLKGKLAALEDRTSDAEQLHSQLYLETEKEKARSAMDRDHLLAQRNELQEKILQIQKRNDALLRENEKLRSDRAAKPRSPVRRDSAAVKYGSSLLTSNQTFQEILQSKAAETPKSTAGSTSAKATFRTMRASRPTSMASEPPQSDKPADDPPS